MRRSIKINLEMINEYTYLNFNILVRTFKVAIII